jgi:hypothetical protein
LVLARQRDVSDRPTTLGLRMWTRQPPTRCGEGKPHPAVMQSAISKGGDHHDSGPAGQGGCAKRRDCLRPWSRRAVLRQER